MNTYQMIIQFFQSLTFSGPSLRQACLSGDLPVSYAQAKRLVKRAVARGELQLARDKTQPGSPLTKVSPK